MKAMRTYTIVLEPEEGGGYFVAVPALPGWGAPQLMAVTVAA
jgi:hypothetical protein